MTSPRRSCAEPTPFALTEKGVRVAVRVTAKASRAGILGVEVDAAGKAWLKARLTESPERGKANRALIKLLARAWGLAPTRLAVTAGTRAGRKTVLIAGGDKALLRQLEASL